LTFVEGRLVGRLHDNVMPLLSKRSCNLLICNDAQCIKLHITRYYQMCVTNCFCVICDPRRNSLLTSWSQVRILHGPPFFLSALKTSQNTLKLRCLRAPVDRYWRNEIRSLSTQSSRIQEGSSAPKPCSPSVRITWSRIFGPGNNTLMTEQ